MGFTMNKPRIKFRWHNPETRFNISEPLLCFLLSGATNGYKRGEHEEFGHSAFVTETFNKQTIRNIYILLQFLLLISTQLTILH